MAVSSTSSGSLKTGVCLSTDRPDNPYNGQVIYETDTNRTLIYDNSAWVVISDPSLLSYSGTGATVTADAMTVAGENVTPYTGRRNLLFNGAMQVAQRSTSVAGITGSGYYTADRWNLALSSLGTWTQSVETDAPIGSGFSKSIKLLCTTADGSPAATDAFRIDQRLEGQDLQLTKKGSGSAEQLTLSFWVKSNVTGTYIVWLYDADNARSVSATYSISASGTWEKKSVTFPADTSGVFDNDNGSSLWVSFVLAAGTNWTSGTLADTWQSDTTANRAVGQTNLAAATNNYWQITGVQLELGDKATPFEHRSFGEELALCQRYFEKSSNYEDAVGNSMGTSVLTIGSVYVDGWQGTTNIPFKVNKRSAPSVAMYGSSGANNGWVVYDHAGTAYNAVGTYAVNINQHNFRILVSTWNGSSGTLNYTNGLSYRAVGAWTASAEL